MKYLGGRSDENIWEGGQLIVEVGDLARGVQRRDLLPISAATALVLLFLCTRLLGPKYLANGHVILDQLQKRDLLPIFAGTALVLLFLLGPKYLANGYFKGALLTISDQIPCTPRQCIEGHVILEKLQRRDLLRISEDTDADALSVLWSKK